MANSSPAGWLTRRKLIIVAVVALLSAAALVFWPSDRPDDYRTVTINRGTVESVVIAAGRLRPIRTVNVGAEVSGLVAEVHVDVNSRVEAGQALAEIEPTRLEAVVRQAEASIRIARGGQAEAEAALAREVANLREAEDNLRRRAELASRGLVSTSALESAQIAVDRARAEVQGAMAGKTSRTAEFDRASAQSEDARTALRRARIISPIDGVVISRSIDVGQTLAASFQTPTLFEIASDLSEMRMELSVNEADISEIRIGQDVRFSADAYPEIRFSGKVQQIQPQASVNDNVVSFQVIVAVVNRGGLLKPGMSTTAEIVTAKRSDVMRVPVPAIAFKPVIKGGGMVRIESISIRPSPRRSGGQPSPSGRVTRSDVPPSTDEIVVWRLDPADRSNLVRVPVRIGIRSDEWIEIVSGDLKVGDVIVTGYRTGRTDP
ncbi:MAG: efflux RND transporter periplasmic adaptor subunit [Brevundimonas sp.]|uniref:efflux RND transporter periplasmic adaptor subunit n=1 Tax=Brevundimonas sp. TaxID=1871086 RepID=UPI0022C03CF1|nr:efflux RND transporter periplasmic adaptor subunit [Brevundimonas sp.]